MLYHFDLQKVGCIILFAYKNEQMTVDIKFFKYLQ